jgi:hypothetical protein
VVGEADEPAGAVGQTYEQARSTSIFGRDQGDGGEDPAGARGEIFEVADRGRDDVEAGLEAWRWRRFGHARSIT